MGSPTDVKLRQILRLDRIAVVGCSRHPEKAAHRVPRYMLDHGYDVVPVNPHADEIFDRRAYESLGAVPESVDVVNVFRPDHEVPDVVDEAVRRDDVRAVWMQLGIEHDEAARRAETAGILVVQDRCMKVEHGRLVG